MAPLSIPVKPAPHAQPPVISVAVIVPVLNEASCLSDCLTELLGHHYFKEIIVVDGGSTDATVEIVCKLMSSDTLAVRPVPYLFQSARGRARQMHAGAQAASADVLLFLHADTSLPPDAVKLVREAIAHGYLWGRFDVQLSGRHPLLRLIEWMMNCRSALSSIATGDQGIFVRHDAYRLLGGYASIPLMEDIEFSQRLKWMGKPARLRRQVVTSSRRWEEKGIIRTGLMMWAIRFLYWMGVSPERLAHWYNRHP